MLINSPRKKRRERSYIIGPYALIRISLANFTLPFIGFEFKNLELNKL
jgi:hypothetical protein